MGYGYVKILEIPVALLIVTGFVMVFILVPLWFFRRSALTTLRKVVAAFALTGVLIPLVVIACLATKHGEIFSASVLWVWPGIIGLGVLPRSATSTARILIGGMAILSNVGLYSGLGLVVGSIWKAAKR